MPDPRWSAPEISARFSKIEWTLEEMQRTFTHLGDQRRLTEERCQVLEARVAELEEALDDL